MEQQRRPLWLMASAVASMAIVAFVSGWTIRGLTGPNPNRPQLNIRNSTDVPLGVSYGSLRFEIPPGQTMGFRIDGGDSFQLAGTVAGREVSREVSFWPGSTPQVQAEVLADDQGRLKFRYRSPDE